MRAFSLLELTLVLLILSMLAGFFVSFTIAVKTDEAKDVTRERMEKIRQQVIWYRKVNHRLPCPASQTATIASAAYGREARSGNCSAALGGYPGTLRLAVGAFPTKSTGLADEYMYDGWGRRFRYMVLQEFTKDCAFTDHPVSQSGYAGLTVKDRGGNTESDEELYVLLSHGFNGHGGRLQSGAIYSANSTNANEQQNCDCDEDAAETTIDEEFVEQIESTAASSFTSKFDDLLISARREGIVSEGDLGGTAETCSTSSTGGGSTSSGSSGSSGGSNSSSSSGSSTSSSGGCSGCAWPRHTAGQSCCDASDCETGLKCDGGVCTSCVGPPYEGGCATDDCDATLCQSGVSTCMNCDTGNDICGASGSSSSSSASSSSSGSSSGSGGGDPCDGDEDCTGGQVCCTNVHSANFQTCIDDLPENCCSLDGLPCIGDECCSGICDIGVTDTCLPSGSSSGSSSGGSTSSASSGSSGGSASGGCAYPGTPCDTDEDCCNATTGWWCDWSLSGGSVGVCVGDCTQPPLSQSPPFWENCYCTDNSECNSDNCDCVALPSYCICL